MVDNVVHFNGDRDTRDMMSDAKFFEGYSRWNDSKNRYETWNEAVERVMNMHRNFYKNKMTPELSALIDEAEDLYKKKYFLGAQRALQFGGDQLIKHQMRLYNCTSTYADRAEFFGEFFYVLLCGAGAGVSVQKHHVAKLPKIQNRTKQAKIHIVTDDIEGWGTAADVLMSSYFVGGGKHPEYEGRRVYFDTSAIREKGAMISGGFKAPGPEPLRRALDKIEHLLQGLVLKGATELSPIHVYDISMHLADAVLAGGVRRSATIFLFSPNDEEMMKAKTGNWFIENPQRGRSNNSAVIVRGAANREQFHELMQSVREFGEPGFVFVESTEHTYNPCFTGETIVAVADGRNGVSIKDLAEENRPFTVYSGELNRLGEWKVCIQNAIAFKTGTRKTIKVQLSDGTSFRCTPEHKLAIPGGNYIQAKDSLNVELEGFYTHKDKSYRIINSFSNGYAKQHRMIWEHENGAIEDGFVIDHIVSGTPDFIDNLQLMRKEDHDKKTGSETTGKNNAVFKIADTKKWKTNLSNKAFLEGNPRFLGITNEQLIENARFLKKNGLKITFENLRLLDERTPKSFSKNRFGGKIQNLIDIVDNVAEYVRPKQVDYIKNEKVENVYSNPIVVGITEDLEEDVYDLKVENTSNFYILTSYDENFMNSTGILVHNCVEIGKYPVFIDEKGEKHSGWQGCNLTEINGAMANTEEEFLQACRGAAILGTLQAGYTDFKFISSVSKKIFDREALLGVSITGWMNNPQVLLQPEILQRGATLVREVNRKVASMIGINPAARTTCVKPAGNACTTFDTLIKTENGIMSLKEIFDHCTQNGVDVDKDNIGDGTSFQVVNELKVYDEFNELQDITGLYVNGFARIYEIEFEDGKIYKFTDHHKLKTKTGWKMVCDLTEDDEIESF